MSPQKLSIGELADLLGIPPKTIRHYHKVGVLPEPARAENGYRLYTADDVQTLQTIRRLQAYGLSLRQIAFILHSATPEEHLHQFLRQREAQLADEIAQRQQQQARIQDFLRDKPTPALRPISSQHILHETIRPHAQGLADVMQAVEAQTLERLDHLPHDPDAYGRFWEQVASTFSRSLLPHESVLILWLERYLALATLSPDDRQAQAWLHELRGSRDVPLLAQTLQLPASDALSPEAQAGLGRMMVLLLYEQASPWQQTFLSVLMQTRCP